MIEEWRTIADYPDYAVSDHGRVKRVVVDCRNRTGRIILQSAAPNGYMTVQLFVNRKGKTQRVHRLVCVTFHGAPPSAGVHAAHIDGNQKNNLASNLRWASATENSADKIKHGTIARGTGHGRSKITEELVKEIRSIPRRPRKTGSDRALAQQYNLNHTTIGDIRSRRTWRHVI